MKFPNNIVADLNSYESNYMDLPFENILREYRKKNISEILKKYTHNRFLEIGCGAAPLFREITDFDKMVVVEPGKLFYEMAINQSNANPKILIINDSVENITDKLSHETFDFIVIGGFLHEIQNPDIVLQAIRQICTKNTAVYSFVPNAMSFHRLLAFEMGITESIYQKSDHDKLFQRHNVYDIDAFNKLLIKNRFTVIESGSYFIKPFTHNQMDELLKQGIIDKSCLDGLEKMKIYMPNLGAELFNICKIDD